MKNHIANAVNIGLGFIQSKGLVSIHSVMNKVTGLLLFLFPLTLGLIKLKYSTVIVSSIATASAIQEGYFIGTGCALVTGREKKKTNKN